MGATRTSASAVASKRKHNGASRRKHDIDYAVVTDLLLPGFSRRLSPVAADLSKDVYQVVFHIDHVCV